MEGEAINQYSLSGDLIREWESGISIEKETGFNKKIFLHVVVV